MSSAWPPRSCMLATGGVGLLLIASVRLASQRRDSGGFLGDIALLDYAQRLSEIEKAAPDVARLLPLKLEPAFANPCWRDQNTTQLQCLPAFFLAGALQSGVPDMWSRLRTHSCVSARHDALSHWWTNHPRSRAGGFQKYIDRFSGHATLKSVQREPRTLLGEASPATFSFMMSESLRLHYLYLDAFDKCWATCRSKSPPKSVPECSSKEYRMEHEGLPEGAKCLYLKCVIGNPGLWADSLAVHCYSEAQSAMVSADFNLPAFAATVLPKLRVVVMLREPSTRLWAAFWSYGQFPARYGASLAGFSYYFCNQSKAFLDCAERYGTRSCALRFEAHGPEQAGVYYHCDQLIKGMYALFLREWAMYFDKLIVIRTDDYFRMPFRHVRRVWRWLGLPHARPLEMQQAENVPVHDELKDVNRKHGEPPEDLLRPVRRFYAPFNRALARLQRDSGLVTGDWAEE